MSDRSDPRDRRDAGAEFDFKAFQSGDLVSLRSVLAHFSPLIESVAASYARDESDRDELFHRISIRLWERRMQYTGRGSLRGWINKVAGTVCSNWAEERKVRWREEARYISETESLKGARDPGNPAEAVELSELLARLRHSLSTLPRRQRDTFLLVHVDGYTTAEVATILGVRPATVRSNLRHARKRLRTLMKDYWE